MYYLTAEASFDSAHFLNEHDGKCSNLHGHRWRMVAKIAGEQLKEDGPEKGMLIDFSDFKKALQEIADSLDHTFIYEQGSLQLATLDALEAEGFSFVVVPFRPTAENLAKYLFERLRKEGFPVCLMTVYETPDNCAMYEGD